MIGLVRVRSVVSPLSSSLSDCLVRKLSSETIYYRIPQILIIIWQWHSIPSIHYILILIILMILVTILVTQCQNQLKCYLLIIRRIACWWCSIPGKYKCSFSTFHDDANSCANRCSAPAFHAWHSAGDAILILMSAPLTTAADNNQ